MKKFLYIGIYIFFFIGLLMEGAGFWSALLWPVVIVVALFFIFLANFR